MELCDKKEASRLTKEEWREYTKTVWHIANVSDSVHPAVFPEEIPHRLIKLFSFVQETVLDPFAGTGTTARVALRGGRSAVCVEVNRRYYGRICRENQNDIRDGSLVVKNQDASDLHFLADGAVDLIITSPPYWNKADYGSDPRNLGLLKGYVDYIEGLRPVWSECCRVLSPSRKLCVVTANVNQHTDHGLLTFPLPFDIASVLREVGFVMVGEVIWSKDGTGGRWGSWGAQRPIFGSYPYPPNFLFKNVHEHILIFMKPSGRPVRGPKVLPYSSLMRIP